MFLSYFYTPLIDKYTREYKKKGTATLLDSIYANTTHIVNSMKTGIFKTDITDHYSIFCITDQFTNINKSSFFTKRGFGNKNISKFKKYLNNFSWTNILGGNCETTYTSFHIQFSQIFKTSLPENLTKALRKSIEKKHILKYVYQKNPTVENQLVCTTFNNKLISLLRIREKEYIEGQLELNKTDLPRTWKIIKDIVGQTKTQNNIKHTIYIMGN